MNTDESEVRELLFELSDQHIFELRRKLEPDPGRPRYLVTVRKFGYCLKAA